MIPVQNQNIPFTLVGKHMFLGLHILRHVLVHIQMVGGQIGHYGNVAAAVHVHELEGAELPPPPSPRGAMRPTSGKRGLANVPPPRRSSLPPGASQPESRGGGLPVGAGDCNHGAGTDLEKYLHLRGHRRPRRRSASRAGFAGCIPGVRNTTSASKFSRYPAPQPELQSLLLQVQDLPVQLLPVRPVAARNPAPGFQQQPGQGPVADPSPKINSRFCRHSARSASSFPFAIPFLNSAPRAPFFPPSIPLPRTRLQDLACSGAASLSRGIGAVQRNSKSIYFLRKGPGGKAPSRR